MNQNRLLLLVALLLCGAFSAAAQRYTNLGIVLLSPADGTVIDNGDSKPLQVQLTNNGPDTFLTTDTLYIFGSLLNGAGNTAVKGQPGDPIPPGVTATLQFPGPFGTITNVRTEATDTTVSLCLSIITGNMMSPGITTDVLDTLPLNNTACSNITFKGVAATGIAGKDNPALSYLKIYPNPAHDNIAFDITLKGNEPVIASVQDMAGRHILSENYGTMSAGTHSLRMDISGLKPGMYMVTLYSGTAKQTGKMIVR
jgi:hypothetical protein